MPSLAELLADKDFVALSPQDQADVRRRFFESNVKSDPDFQALSSADQLDVMQQVTGAKPGGFTDTLVASAKEAGAKFGLGEAGPIEKLVGPRKPGGYLASDIGQSIDTGLSLLNAIPTGVGNAVSDIVKYGGAGLGYLANKVGLAGPEAAIPQDTLASSVIGGTAGMLSPFAMARAAAGPRTPPRPVEATQPQLALPARGMTSREVLPSGEPRVFSAGEQPVTRFEQGTTVPPGEMNPANYVAPPPGESGLHRPLPHAEAGPRIIDTARESIRSYFYTGNDLITQAESNRRTLEAASDWAQGKRPLNFGPVGHSRWVASLSEGPSAADVELPRLPAEHVALELVPRKDMLVSTENSVAEIRMLSAPTRDVVGQPRGGGSLLELAAKKRGTIPVEEAIKLQAGTELPVGQRTELPTSLGVEADAIKSGPLGTPTTWRMTPLGNQYERANFWAMFKYRSGGLTPRIWDYPMHELLKDLPGPLQDTQKFAYRAMSDSEAIEKNFNRIVASAYQGLSSESKASVRAALDGTKPLSELSAAEQASFASLRNLTNTIGEPGMMRYDYLPHVRDSVSAQVVTKIGDTPISKVIELVPGETYVPVRAQNLVPKKYTPYFEKARTSDAPVDYTVDPFPAHASAYARNLVLNGGTDKLTGRTYKPLLAQLRVGLQNTPEPMLEMVANWTNDVLGVPKAKVGQVFGKNTDEIVHAIKAWEYIRTIGGNPLSPAINLVQSWNVFSEARLSSFLGGLRDLANPVIRAEAEARGVIGTLSKADVDAIGTAGALDTLSDKMGLLFKKSENLVRLHAFATGLREAAVEGLTGEKAVNSAMDFVHETHFRYSREALPESLRRGGIASLISQYKPFMINQTLFMKNLLTKDLQNLGHELPFKRTAKFIGGLSLLFGSDATTMGWDQTLSEWFTHNKETLTLKGFFPSMGIFVANQIGMGAMPLESFRALLFMLPGPAVSHVADAVSIMSGLPSISGAKPRADAPYGTDYSLGPTFNQPMTAEQFASKVTRSIPFAGVFANRLRRALLELDTPGQIREATTLPQAFPIPGLHEPLSSTSTLLQSGTGRANPLKTAVGVLDPSVEARMELRRDNTDLIRERDLAVRNATRLWRDGKIEEAQAMLAAFEKRNGVPAFITPGAVRSSVIESVLPSLERQIRKSPRELRTKLLEDLHSAGE